MKLYHRYLNKILVYLKLRHPWISPAGYKVSKLRDFSQPLQDDVCNLCGQEDSECPCFRY